jgi:hypothetical protein
MCRLGLMELASLHDDRSLVSALCDEDEATAPRVDFVFAVSIGTDFVSPVRIRAQRVGVFRRVFGKYMRTLGRKGQFSWERPNDDRNQLAAARWNARPRPDCLFLGRASLDRGGRCLGSRLRWNSSPLRHGNLHPHSSHDETLPQIDRDDVVLIFIHHSLPKVILTLYMAAK